jgi:hypothetical protein
VRQASRLLYACYSDTISQPLSFSLPLSKSSGSRHVAYTLVYIIFPFSYDYRPVASPCHWFWQVSVLLHQYTTCNSPCANIPWNIISPQKKANGFLSAAKNCLGNPGPHYIRCSTICFLKESRQPSTAYKFICPGGANNC